MHWTRSIERSEEILEVRTGSKTGWASLPCYLSLLFFSFHMEGLTLYLFLFLYGSWQGDLRMRPVLSDFIGGQLGFLIWPYLTDEPSSWRSEDTPREDLPGRVSSGQLCKSGLLSPTPLLFMDNITTQPNCSLGNSQTNRRQNNRWGSHCQ